jgi:iron complex transport system permease protein
VLGLLALLVLLALTSVAVGAKAVPLDAVWQGLFSPTGLEDDVIVRRLRVPRTLFGLVVGIALGMAGALVQGHTRNPLADPGLLGVNAGAGFLVVIAIYLFDVVDPAGYVWFALVGALGAAAVVFVAGASGRGGSTPVALALAGAAVTALLVALTSAVILLDVDTLDAYRFWVVGSLAGRDGAVLGFSVRRTRVLGIVAVSLLAGAATAMCGPIAFLGLVVPHVVRALTGPDYRWLLPGSGLAGAVLLLAADVLGRVVVRPGELQVGIVLALVGALFFIALVRRRALVSI